MRKILTLTICLLSVICAKAQMTMTVRMTDGKVKSYKTAEIKDVKIEQTGAVEMGNGLYWATMNLGASSPEENGWLFAWGETEPKTEFYNADGYKFGNVFLTPTKYNKTDKLYDLEDEDDAATANWGSSWRMPTVEEYDWLYANSTFSDDNINGVYVLKITSNETGKSIYLPKGGVYYSGSGDSNCGFYWTKSIIKDRTFDRYPQYASNFAFHSANLIQIQVQQLNRYAGMSVRAVTQDPSAVVEMLRITFKDETTETIEKSDIAKIDFEYSAPDFEYVDMGLSVKWAKCNLGATKPSEIGDYFAWGETEPKEEYTWANYKFSGDENGDVMTKYAFDEWGNIDDKYLLDDEDDAVATLKGGYWQMPTRQQIYELYKKCSFVETEQDGVKGILYTSPTTGNSIFLPLGGFYSSNGLESSQDLGYYWTKTQVQNEETHSYQAYGMKIYFENDNWYSQGFNIIRYRGQNIRAVYEEPQTDWPAVTTLENGVLTIGTNETEIADEAYYKRTDIKEIRMPNTITKIGTRAFAEMTNLKKITMSTEIETIGDEAFYMTKRLSVIGLPLELKTLGKSCFRYSGVEAILVPVGIKAIPEYCFADSKLKTINLDFALQTIGVSAFRNCLNLTEIHIPENVKSIANYAFYHSGVTVLDDVPTEATVSATALGNPFLGAEAPIMSDSYRNGSYYTAYQGVNLSDKASDDIIDVALSQVGYTAGSSDTDLRGNTTEEGSYSEAEYSVRGGSFGTTPGLWCSEFASWCASLAGIPENQFPKCDVSNDFIKNVVIDYYPYSDVRGANQIFSPDRGDVILFTTTENGEPTHTGLINSWTENLDGTITVKTVEGNVSNKVVERTYTIDADGNLNRENWFICGVGRPSYK